MIGEGGVIILDEGGENIDGGEGVNPILDLLGLYPEIDFIIFL